MCWTVVLINDTQKRRRRIDTRMYIWNKLVLQTDIHVVNSKSTHLAAYHAHTMLKSAPVHQ